MWPMARSAASRWRARWDCHCVPDPQAEGGMWMSRTAEEQRRLDFVLEMYREVLIAQDSSKVDRYISPDYIQHSSLAPPGRDALKEFLDMIRVRSPQASSVIHRAF